MSQILPVKAVSVEWSTPDALFRALHAEFGFTVDAAAAPENALLPRYWTAQDDGPSQDWAGERVWCNPPYDARSITRFVEAGWRGTWLSAEPDSVAVFLLPTKADQAWWHTYATKCEVRFIRGRLTFGGAPSPAAFPCCVVVMERGRPACMRSMRRP